MTSVTRGRSWHVLFNSAKKHLLTTALTPPFWTAEKRLQAGTGQSNDWMSSFCAIKQWQTNSCENGDKCGWNKHRLMLLLTLTSADFFKRVEERKKQPQLWTLGLAEAPVSPQQTSRSITSCRITWSYKYLYRYHSLTFRSCICPCSDSVRRLYVKESFHVTVEGKTGSTPDSLLQQ